MKNKETEKNLQELIKNLNGVKFNIIYFINTILFIILYIILYAFSNLNDDEILLKILLIILTFPTTISLFINLFLLWVKIKYGKY